MRERTVSMPGAQFLICAAIAAAGTAMAQVPAGPPAPIIQGRSPFSPEAVAAQKAYSDCVSAKRGEVQRYSLARELCATRASRKFMTTIVKGNL